MIPIYLDITDKVKSIINKNVCSMFDLLLSACEGLSYREILSDIFSQYSLDVNYDMCVRTVKELYYMTQDGYERDNLSSFHEWTLYHTILWWRDTVDDVELEEIPQMACKNGEGINMYVYLNNIDNYLDFLFEDWDFLSAEEIYAIYRKNYEILDKFLHINIERYLELMPTDIQIEYKVKKETEKRSMQNKNGATINITGGQVNIAKDNAIINAIQNNGVSDSELDTIIKRIMENLSELKKEDAETIIDAMEIAKEELDKSKPRASRLRNCITLIAPMFTIANGIPTLVQNLQRFVEYIEAYIH